MSTETSPKLPLLFEKRFPQPLKTKLATYCDQHDLVAVAPISAPEVIVYRLNGQMAFRTGRRAREHEVTVVKWKPDGSLLGVAWSDGRCGVYSGENGKLLSETSVTERPSQEDWKLDLSPDDDDDDDKGVDTESSVPVCMGWTAHKAGSKNDPSGHHNRGLTTEEWQDDSADGLINEESHAQRSSGISHLTSAISTLDVTTTLPRVSAIPAHSVRSGPHGSNFTTQANIDGLLDSTNSFSSTIDTLITCGTSGFTNILLRDSVNIGSFHLPYQPLMHASHPQCESQVILSSEQGGDGNLHLHYIDLPLNTLQGSLLHVVASNTKRLQSLIAYIKQTIRCVQHDYTTGIQFPTRLMNNINEELAEKEEGDLVTSLTHLAMTGNFTPAMLEWLTDIVKETNHKRWEQAMNTMYANMQNHVFMNLSPALDRLSIATSTLRGHARFHDDTTNFVPPDVFTVLLDDIDSLRLVSQKVQQIITTEHRQFRAFIKWMRVMIDVGIAGPGTKAANEIEERDIQNLDYALILEYIKSTLSRSKAADYVEQRPEMRGSVDKPDFVKHPVISALTRDSVMRVLEQSTSQNGRPTSKLDLGGLQDPQVLLNLPSLVVRAAAQVRVIIDSITQWQSRMLSTPSALSLKAPLNLDASTIVEDLGMFPTNHDDRKETVTCLLVRSHNDPSLSTRHTIARGADSEPFHFNRTDVKFQSSTIIQTKLLSDIESLVLSKAVNDDKHLLLRVSWESSRTPSMHRIDTFHVFSDDDGFIPTHFVVGGRLNKMVCVVFGSTVQDWKVLDLNGCGTTPATN